MNSEQKIAYLLDTAMTRKPADATEKYVARSRDTDGLLDFGSEGCNKIDRFSLLWVASVAYVALSNGGW